MIGDALDLNIVLYFVSNIQKFKYVDQNTFSEIVFVNFKVLK